jgi:uncharacterized protein (DUF3820 family)
MPDNKDFSFHKENKKAYSEKYLELTKRLGLRDRDLIYMSYIINFILSDNMEYVSIKNKIYYYIHIQTMSEEIDGLPEDIEIASNTTIYTNTRNRIRSLFARGLLDRFTLTKDDRHKSYFNISKEFINLIREKATGFESYALFESCLNDRTANIISGIVPPLRGKLVFKKYLTVPIVTENVSKIFPKEVVQLVEDLNKYSLERKSFCDKDLDTYKRVHNIFYDLKEGNFITDEYIDLPWLVKKGLEVNNIGSLLQLFKRLSYEDIKNIIFICSKHYLKWFDMKGKFIKDRTKIPTKLLFFLISRAGRSAFLRGIATQPKVMEDCRKYFIEMDRRDKINGK